MAKHKRKKTGQKLHVIVEVTSGSTSSGDIPNPQRFGARADSLVSMHRGQLTWLSELQYLFRGICEQ